MESVWRYKYCSVCVRIGMSQISKPRKSVHGFRHEILKKLRESSFNVTRGDEDIEPRSLKF